MRWILIALIFGLGLTAGFEISTAYWGSGWFSTIENLPKTFGASSWLHFLYWIGGAIIALAALVSIDQRNRQAKAEFLLRLYERWEALGEARTAFDEYYSTGCNHIKAKHSELTDRAQVPKMREYFEKEGAKIHDSEDTAEIFEHFIHFLTFLETLGHFVKRRYVSFSDVRDLFKGTVISADIVFSDYIKNQWQNRSGMPPGLLSNALYLFRRTRWRENLVNTVAFWRN